MRTWINKVKIRLTGLRFRSRKFVVVAAFLLLVVLPLIVIVGLYFQNLQSGDLPDGDPSKGMIYKGLGPRQKAGPCKGMFAVNVAKGTTVCTHGPDPAPPGVDVRKRREPEGDSAKKALINDKEQDVAGISCNGDGQSGRRVQALYVRASDREDNYGKYLDSFKAWASNIDQQVMDSATKTGGNRTIRYVTDGNCELIIENVVISPEGDDSYPNTVKELRAKGFNKNNRKYLIWRDANQICGMGDVQLDDRPELGNFNNLVTGHAIIDNGCWGTTGGVTEMHELGHVLGAVQRSAPHHTEDLHCKDPYDVMCRNLDTSEGRVSEVCPESNSFSFDCNNDDYFSTNPPEGSYIASHWNLAYNEFLGGDEDKRPKFVPGPAGDVYAINREGGSGKTEVHALSASSDFREFSIHAASGLHATPGNTWSFAMGLFYDGDYIPDIFAINRNGGSGNTELHILSGKSNFADFALQTDTALAPTTGDNWVFDIGNGPDEDPRSDLFAINKQGGSGKTEVHILQGGPEKDYRDFSLHAETGLHATDKNWDMVLGGYSDNFGAGTDLYAINRRGASGKTEIHILSAESEYKDFILHAETALEATDNAGWLFTTGYFDNDLKADLYAINRKGGSGKTEVHVLSAASDFKEFISHAASGLEPINNTNWTIAPSQEYQGESAPNPAPTATPTPTPTVKPVTPAPTDKPITPIPTLTPPVGGPNPTSPPNPTTGPVPTWVCGGSPHSVCATPTPTPRPTNNPDNPNPTHIIPSQTITVAPSVTPTPTPDQDDCLDVNQTTPERIMNWIQGFFRKISDFIQRKQSNPQDPAAPPQPCIRQ